MELSDKVLDQVSPVKRVVFVAGSGDDNLKEFEVYELLFDRANKKCWVQIPQRTELCRK